MKPTTATAARSIELPEAMGIEQAAALHSLLAPFVEVPDPVALDGGRVSRVHTAGLQVLAAFVRTRAAAGRATNWSEASPVLRQSAASLGLQDTLVLSTAAATR